MNLLYDHCQQSQHYSIELNAVFIQIQVSVGEVARGYFDIDRPPWSSKHVESTLSALFVLVLVVTFIIQLLLAVIWKVLFV